MKKLISAAFALLITNLCFAQLNMTQLSNWDENSISTSGVYYNDLWGYVDDQDNEYAILGSPDKVHFIDVTNPASPVLKGEFTGGATTIWRDMKSYDHYVYAVADQGSEGLMIFDMSALPNGNITKVYQENNVFSRAHNIYIDPPNARMYVVGANTQNNGWIVYSLADPANPTVIANIGLAGGYVHDIFVKNNIAYCSHGYNGLYVYDATNAANPVQQANINTGAYNHSSWLTEDGAYLIYAEEVPSGEPMGLINMSGVLTNDLSIESTFAFPLEAPQATDVTYHNPYVINNYAVVSSYWDGVTIIDLSNPANPQRVAWFDTAPNNVGNYPAIDGCWGVYPYFPSGNIIASDSFTGLYVLGTTISLNNACNNSTQDPFETGTDCGGFCHPCVIEPTCSDGLMNGDEQGVDCGGINCTPCIEGCTNPDAHNYNANAQLDNGTCLTCADGLLNGDEIAIDCGGLKCTPCVEGCTNAEAHNYNPNAQIDNGSCENCADGLMNGDELAIDCGGAKCSPCVEGCTNPEAHNYNANAQLDNGTCETCSDGIMNGDEVAIDCGGTKCTPCIEGCTNPDAHNYNANADIDNGSCETCNDGILNGDEVVVDCGGTKCTPCVEGCMNPDAHNYNANAVIDDGSCETCADGVMNGDELAIDCGGAKCTPCIEGCTNPDAHNYDLNAQLDNGTCLTCNDGILNGDEVIVDCGGTKCAPCLEGCTNPNAHNYDPNATVDNGSCLTCNDGILNGDEVITDCGGTKCAPCVEGCMNPDAHNYNANAVIDNGSCETCADDVMNGDELAIDCGGTKCTPCIEGCTNPDAHNYNANAQLDNGSCETCADGVMNGDEVAIDCGGTKCTPCVEGCTTPDAHNYDANANLDNGTCETCNDGLLNGDEVVADCGGTKCTPCVEGCTNPAAHNYDSNAVIDNGSCETCADSVMNGDEQAIDCGGTKCTPCIEGCTDANAHNYDPNAQLDNGSCLTCNDGTLNGDETGIDCGGNKCAPCSDECDTYDFTNAIVTYQTDAGSAQVLDGGATAYIYNNAWKAVPLNYEVTTNTVIEFDFASTIEGEVHGLGFDNNLNYGPNHFLVFYGFQGYAGTFPTPNYNGSGNYEHFTIKIGDNFTGFYEYLILIADNDQSPTGNSYYRNFQIYEDFNNNLICDDAPTCTDGIQNGDEAGIDCGGTNCIPCVEGCMNPDAHNYDPNAQIDNGTCETCNDGILNGDETQVDCGGAKCGICCVSTVNLTIQFDNYANEITWRFEDSNGSIIASGQGVGENNPYQISEDICLAAGCYEFIIEDSYGDGLCCQAGEGWYWLRAEDGSTIVSNYEFGSIVTTPFCIDPPPPTCTDGIMNGDEVAVDCGGSNCAPCVAGCMDAAAHNYNPDAQIPGETCLTCADGIMNGDEVATDCGGAKCTPCVEGCTTPDAHNYNPDAVIDNGTCETCTDGVMNGDETDIDCGGSCPTPCCLDSLILTDMVDVLLNQQAADHITADHLITNNAVVSYSAGNYLEFLPGFEVTTGCDFTGFIQGCSPAAIAPGGISVSYNVKSKQGIILYNLQETSEVSVTLVDAEGNTVSLSVPTTTQAPGAHELTFDMAQFNPGLYYVKLRFAHFEIARKLIVISQ